MVHHSDFFPVLYTCPGLIDNVISYDVRVVCKIPGHCGPELCKTVSQAIGVVVEVLVSHSSSLSELVQPPRMLSTVLEDEESDIMRCTGSPSGSDHTLYLFAGVASGGVHFEW